MIGVDLLDYTDIVCNLRAHKLRFFIGFEQLLLTISEKSGGITK